MSAHTYHKIFCQFFKIFPFFSSDSFAGITADFSDAILAGILTAASKIGIENAIDYIRGCTFHFKKNIHDFARKSRLTEAEEKKLSNFGHMLVEYASKDGCESTKFKTAEEKFFQFLATFPAGEKWGKWWKECNHGFHWRILFDSGLSSFRKNLYNTTNAAESQNHVLKNILGLKQLPQFGLRPLMKAIATKEEKYLLALGGSLIATHRNKPQSRKRKSRKQRTTDGAGESIAITKDGLPITSKLLTEQELAALEQEGSLSVPAAPTSAVSSPLNSRIKMNQSLLRAESSQGPPVRFPLKRSKLSPGSLPLWRWQDNSCAFDSMLALLVFSTLQQPHLFSRSQDAPDSSITTRLTDLSHFRIECCQFVERVINLWSLGSIATDVRLDNLTTLRNDFRRALYPRMGMRQRAGMTSFASADLAFEVLLQALSARTSDFQRASHEKVVIPRIVIFKSSQNIGQMIEDLSAECRPGVWFAIEFHVIGATDDLLDAYQKMSIPLSLTFGGQQYDLLAVIDCNGSHYRTFILNRNDKPLRPGMYLFDPYMFDPSISKSRVELVNKLPATPRQLLNRLPPFSSSKSNTSSSSSSTPFKPHIFVYLQQPSSEGDLPIPPVPCQ
jgi:hypothetical protein